MNNKNLVLVVGAGGSAEVNLPIGAELKTSIAEAVNFAFEDGYNLSSGDSAIMAAINQFVREQPSNETIDVNPYVAAGRRIYDAMPQAPSIDNFIHAHKDDEKIALCGKLAIAKCILEAEARSRLKTLSDSLINFDGVAGTWFNLFFQQFIAPFPISEIAERFKKIAFITFNYDRCIEHYFYCGLMNYYGIDGLRAGELMRHLTILHPYGYLGPLAWADEINPIPFGSKVVPGQLFQIAQNLKTFTEGTNRTHSDIIAIKQAIESTKKIAFLGFAFSQQNLELLFADTGATRSLRSVEFFGTALGLSASNVLAIKSQLTSLARANHGSPVYLEREHTCAKLIDEYSRGLAV
jgi:hypothetical protein